jgi:transposase
MSMLGQHVHNSVEVLFPDPSDVLGANTILPVCPNCEKHNTEINFLRAEVGYWKNCHQRALEREALLKRANEELQAKLKLRERQLFERHSEKGTNSKEQIESDAPAKSKRKRGQQRGAKGHGRKRQENLPVVEEFVELAQDQQCCPCCGLPLDTLCSTQDSEVLEVQVQAYRRKYRRRRYLRTCNCEKLPRIITAPVPPKLIAKGILGISFWVTLLLGKFLFQRPLSRILTELGVNHKLNVSPGTVTDGLKKIAPLFTPLYEAIADRNISQGHWHADETRWMVFAEIEGKVGPRWYLWVFCTSDTVVFRLEPNRSSKVVMDHFGNEATGILSVDRYSAYKAILKYGRILLAFCWAHVRRDFLAVFKDRPEHKQWAIDWIKKIGQLYALNKKRLKLLNTPEFESAQQNLQQAVDAMAICCNQQLDEPKLYTACRKVLESLKRHWSGLVLFVAHPEIPMDNNRAERQLRPSVVGRKNYYGAGALWSANLTAMLFSLFQTLGMWNINPRLWLSQYLLACAKNQCSPPDDAKNFLPWNMAPEKLDQFRISEAIDTS